MSKLTVIAISISAILAGPSAFAQDYPQAADMRTLGQQEGRPGPPPQTMTKRDIAKVCKKQFCLAVANMSRYRVVGFRYSIKQDLNGQPIWSANQFAPNEYIYAGKVTIWFAYRKDVPCDIDIQVTLDVKGHWTDFAEHFSTCGDKLYYAAIRDPRRGYVIVEHSPVNDVPPAQK